MVEVFLSHSTKDDDIATRIYKKLNASGIEVWIDHINGIEPGDKWRQQIEKAVKSAKCGLFVLSQNSITAEYCEAEWGILLSTKKKLFITVIDETTPTDFPIPLGTIQATNLFDKFDEELDKLVRSIKTHLGKSSVLDKEKTSANPPISRQSISKPQSITAQNPLLIGVLLDVSRSMINTLTMLSQSPTSDLSPKKLGDALNMLVEKATFYCKTPEADSVLPRFTLFAYGFGFGRLRKTIANLFSKIGIQSDSTTDIPTSAIRDLFFEIAQKENLPITPSASVLYRHWHYYQKSVEAQIMDTGMGDSAIGEGLEVVSERFEKEFNLFANSSSMLLIISDGQSQANDYELIKTINKLRERGVQIICCYFGKGDLIPYKKLYIESETSWTAAVKRLFDCASTVSSGNIIMTSIIDLARERGWEIPAESKLFIQINHTQALEEVVNILTSPLKLR